MSDLAYTQVNQMLGNYGAEKDGRSAMQTEIIKHWLLDVHVQNLAQPGLAATTQVINGALSLKANLRLHRYCCTFIGLTDVIHHLLCNHSIIRGKMTIRQFAQHYFQHWQLHEHPTSLTRNAVVMGCNTCSSYYCTTVRLTHKHHTSLTRNAMVMGCNAYFSYYCTTVTLTHKHHTSLTRNAMVMGCNAYFSYYCTTVTLTHKHPTSFTSNAMVMGCNTCSSYYCTTVKLTHKQQTQVTGHHEEGWILCSTDITRSIQHIRKREREGEKMRKEDNESLPAAENCICNSLVSLIQYAMWFLFYFEQLVGKQQLLAAVCTLKTTNIWRGTRTARERVGLTDSYSLQRISMVVSGPFWSDSISHAKWPFLYSMKSQRKLCGITGEETSELTRSDRYFPQIVHIVSTWGEETTDNWSLEHF